MRVPDGRGMLTHDPRDLDALRRVAKGAEPNSPEYAQAVKDASKKLEALFVEQMMKAMRATLPDSDPLGSSGQTQMRSLLDSQLAGRMADRGLGLSDFIAAQLMPRDASTLGTSDNDAGQTDTDFLQQMATPTGGRTTLDYLRQRWLSPASHSAGEVASSSSTPKEPVSQRSSQGPEAFVQRLWADAKQAEKASGIPAAFILGQAGLETGWGRHDIRHPDGRSSFNLFGIKASQGWTGATVDATTTEYVNGQAQKTVEKFRAYGSYAEAMTDYARLLTQNKRYEGAISALHSPLAFAQNIQKAGYATDPAYASKLNQAIQRVMGSISS